MLSNSPKTRTVIYLLSLLAAVVAPVVAVSSPEYGAAVTTVAGVLAAAAGVSAVSNLAGGVAPTTPAPESVYADDGAGEAVTVDVAGDALDSSTEVGTYAE